jgi:hypothetical protein
MRFCPAALIPTLAATMAFLLLWTACGGGSGTMLQQGSPEASLSASTVTFAGQNVGIASSAVALTLSNTDSVALSITGISIAGPNSGDFTESNTCGSSLAAGAACSINLTFTPAGTGPRTAMLSVSDDAPGSPLTVTITGTGLTPSNVDPLGTAAGIEASCSSVDGGDQGEPNGTCYNVALTCPGVADQTVGVKVNNPSGTKGTVTFMVGGGGHQWYDQNFKFGTTAVDMVAQAGFTTAQISFYGTPVGFPPSGTFAGWLTGPGGVRALSCRFATVEMWVRDHIHQANAPFCHTGNSAGSAAPFYALAYYGFDAYYNFVELSSGPPFTRIDHGCICNPEVFHDTQCGQGSQSECYRIDGTKFVDPAYDPTTHICTDAMDSGDTTNQQLFINDSLDSPAATKSYSHVDIHFVFGGLDTGAAEPQAMEWIPLITAKNPITFDCVADAPHPIPDVLDGAQKIANDLIASCH